MGCLPAVMTPLPAGSSSSPAPTPEIVDIEKGVPVISPAPVYNSRMGHVYDLPVDTIKAVDYFPMPAGFQREGTREASFTYSIGVYVEPILENAKLFQ